MRKNDTQVTVTLNNGLVRTYTCENYVGHSGAVTRVRDSLGCITGHARWSHDGTVKSWTGCSDNEVVPALKFPGIMGDSRHRA